MPKILFRRSLPTSLSKIAWRRLNKQYCLHHGTELAKRRRHPRTKACKCLEATNPEEEDTESEEPLSLAEKMKLKHRKRKAGELDNGKKSDYLNVDYICGSAAEVERLWSICKYIITTNRSSLTPILLEALVFLRVNRSFWDLRLVQEAYANATMENRNTRLQKDVAEDDQYLADEIGNIFEEQKSNSNLFENENRNSNIFENEL